MKSPYLRLLVAAVFVVPVLVAEGVVWGFAPRYGKVPVAIVAALIASVVGIAAYRLYVRLMERRPVTELGTTGAFKELAAGLAIGALLMTVCVAVLAAFGAYRVTGTHGLAVLVIPLAVAIGSGVIEEILFRGVIFRLLEEGLGTWIALAISAALFGFIHLSNPGATVQGAIAIVLEAGIMLAAAYLLTRRLWLPIGIHAAWNFTQSGVYGAPTSGFKMDGLLAGQLSGPTWLAGGDFGIEASLVAVLICTAAGAGMLALAWRRGRFIAPSWRRPAPVPAAGR